MAVMARMELLQTNAVHWQPALGRDGLAEGVRDVDQAIRIILGTRKGSDPHRPEFGFDGFKYLDYPARTAVPHLVREAVASITRWEPRAVLVRVTPFVTDERARIRVQWRLADGVERETLVAL